MKRLIRFDWAIKRLLRNKANFTILEGFLSELLGDNITIESILESESNKRTGDNKSNRVDLLIRNNRSELVIIEIQSNRMHDYLMRMLFGTSMLIVDNLSKGADYNEIKKVISVNIVYFDLGQGKDYIYYGTTSFTGVHEHDVLQLSGQQELIYHTNQISKLYPEYYIIKVNQFNDIAKNTLDEWIYFLKNEEIKDGFKAKGLKEAKAELDILKLNNEELADYENFIKEARDYNSLTVTNYKVGKAEGLILGEELGIKKGEELAMKKSSELFLQKQREMARKCLGRGMDIAEVAELTGMSVDEVAKLNAI